MFYENGSYNWEYKYHMLKKADGVIVLLISFAVTVLIISCTFAAASYPDHILETFRTYSFVFWMIGILFILSYFVCILLYGKEYLYIYSMDEKGIRFWVRPEKKNRTGVNITEHFIDFRNVRQVKVRSAGSALHIRGNLLFTIVYVEKEDLEDVLEAMKSYLGPDILWTLK